MVSIIVPVYETEQYLSECIQSLLAQTYKNIEIILVNDGSTDKSGAICDKYEREYPSIIKVIHQENQGVSVARNNGIAASFGEWVMFVDSDDWIAPEMLEVMLARAIMEDCDICACGKSKEYPEGRSIRSSFVKLDGFQLKHQDKIVVLRNFLSTRELGGFGEDVRLNSPCAKLYRKEFLLNCGICFAKDVIISEDEIFSMYAIQLSSKTIFCKGSFYHYRMHDKQTALRHRDDLFKSAEKYLNEIRIFANQFYSGDDAAVIYNTRAVRMLLASIFTTYVLKDAPYTFMQRIRGIRMALKHDLYKNAIRDVSLSLFYTRTMQIQVMLLKFRLVCTYFFLARLFHWRRTRKH